MGHWYEEYYADVDAMRMDDWLARHTDDAIVKFANNPPAVGKEQIRSAIQGLWDGINGLRHEFRAVHPDGEELVSLEVLVHYERRDGSKVVIPCNSVLHRTGQLVSRLTIYMDLAPLFDPEAAGDPSAGLVEAGSP